MSSFKNKFKNKFQNIKTIDEFYLFIKDNKLLTDIVSSYSSVNRYIKKFFLNFKNSNVSIDKKLNYLLICNLLVNNSNNIHNRPSFNSKTYRKKYINTIINNSFIKNNNEFKEDLERCFEDNFKSTKDVICSESDKEFQRNNLKKVNFEFKNLLIFNSELEKKIKNELFIKNIKQIKVDLSDENKSNLIYIYNGFNDEHPKKYNRKFYQYLKELKELMGNNYWNQ